MKPRQLVAREPLVIERAVPPVLVHLEQCLVDTLAQGTAVRHGNTILLRREDRTDDSQLAITAPQGQVLKYRCVEDQGLDLALIDEIASFLRGCYVHMQQTLLGQVVGGDGAAHRRDLLSREVCRSADLRIQ